MRPILPRRRGRSASRAVSGRLGFGSGGFGMEIDDRRFAILPCWPDWQGTNSPNPNGIPRMELRHLRYFNEIANELSFSRAAAKVHIAQPAFSARMRDLEEELGTKLFRCLGSGIALTTAGEARPRTAIARRSGACGSTHPAPACRASHGCHDLGRIRRPYRRRLRQACAGVFRSQVERAEIADAAAMTRLA